MPGRRRCSPPRTGRRGGGPSCRRRCSRPRPQRRRPVPALRAGDGPPARGRRHRAGPGGPTAAVPPPRRHASRTAVCPVNRATAVPAAAAAGVRQPTPLARRRRRLPPPRGDARRPRMTHRGRDAPGHPPPDAVSTPAGGPPSDTARVGATSARGGGAAGEDLPRRPVARPTSVRALTVTPDPGLVTPAASGDRPASKRRPGIRAHTCEVRVRHHEPDEGAEGASPPVLNHIQNERPLFPVQKSRVVIGVERYQAWASKKNSRISKENRPPKQPI